MELVWYSLLEREPRSAAENMAVDQFLLELVEAGRLAVPVLRTYAWVRPTLSLGYHQEWRRAIDPEALERHRVDLVRRWTGGRGVLHDPDEITYSLTAPMREPFGNTVRHNYCAIGRALARFTDLGMQQGRMTPEEESVEKVKQMRHTPCFASLSRSEIEAGGKKMIGSAQKLGRKGFIQHGSIPLHARFHILEEITGTALSMDRLMTSLSDHFAQAGLALPPRETLEDRLVAAFAESFGVTFRDFRETDLWDQREIDRITETRFGDEAWTFRK